MAKHLAFASASSGSKVLVVSHIDASGADDYAVWEVALGKNTEKFQLKFVFTNVQIALPKEILQEDNQFLVFNDNLYFLSPYLTKSQTTKVWLASHHIEEYSEEGEANVDGAIITYGPYKDIKPFSNAKKLRVHYENNSPAIRFPMVQQTIALPSWGNNAKVSNRYSIEHAGALLKAGFQDLITSFEMVQRQTLRFGASVCR